MEPVIISRIKIDSQFLFGIFHAQKPLINIKTNVFQVIWKIINNKIIVHE